MCKVLSIMEKKATTSCGCAVIRYVKDVPHVLLVRPFAQHDAWGIPKGHVNDNETVVDCAIRETLEEAGIEAVLIEPLNPVSTTYKTERKTVRAFIAIQANPNIEPYAADGENVDIRYFPIDELPNIHVYQRPLLAEVKQKIIDLGKDRFAAYSYEACNDNTDSDT